MPIRTAITVLQLIFILRTFRLHGNGGAVEKSYSASVNRRQGIPASFRIRLTLAACGLQGNSLSKRAERRFAAVLRICRRPTWASPDNSQASESRERKRRTRLENMTARPQ